MADHNPEVLAALHRFYIDTLPPEHRNRVDARAGATVQAMALTQALDIVAKASGVDRLTKWHLAATALHRNPARFLEPAALGGLCDVIGAKPEPGWRERATTALSAFAMGDRDVIDGFDDTGAPDAPDVPGTGDGKAP